MEQVKTQRAFNVIYKLFFVDEPDKVYIGSAVEGNARLENHIKSLMSNSHTNKLLQVAFNSKGITKFRWEVLEENYKGRLLPRENYWINEYKSHIKGYNQTEITSAMKINEASKNGRLFIPNELGKYDFSELDKFVGNYNSISVDCLDTYWFKRCRDGNFSKSFWDNLPEESVVNLINGTYSHMRHKVQRVTGTLFKEIMWCIDNNRVNKLMEESNIKTLQLGKVRAKSFMKSNPKYLISHVYVLSALNPFLLDMPRMTKEERSLYRVTKLFKLLESRGQMNKDISIYLPYKLYMDYVGVLSKYSNVSIFCSTNLQGGE